MASSPEASSRPPEKPADAPPSAAALSDNARMKLLKRLQIQENKLQKLLAKSGEIASIEALRKVIEKETLFEPALICLRKQAEVAQESKGAIDPKSFVEKAERLEALETLFIKNLANGNASAVAAGELHKKFASALSPAKPAEQVAASPDAIVSAAPAAAPSPEPVKTPAAPAKPAAVSAESIANARAGTTQTKEETLPPSANVPAAANADKEKPAQKQNGNGNGNRVRPTVPKWVHQEAKNFEQGLTIPATPAPAKEESPKTATEPPKKVEQASVKKTLEKPPRIVKSSGSQDALARIIRDVEKSGVLKRRRGTGEVTVKGTQAAMQIERLVRIFESEEFNEKSAAERERTIRESVELLTTNERLKRDLLSAFEQKGWLTKGGKGETPAKKEVVEKQAVPASPDATSPAPSRGGGERSDLSPDLRSDLKEPTKKGTAEALLHQILIDVGRVEVGKTIPRRMPDGKIVDISGKDMAADIQKIIKNYQTLEFPKKTLKERREIVLRDIENTTSHPRLRADLERAFAAKGWLPQIVETAKAAVETKTAEPKPPAETEPRKVEPVPSRGGGERSDLSPDVRSDLKEPLPTPIEAAKSAPEPPPKDAPATLAGNPPPKESTPATPPATPPLVAEKMPVPESSAKAKPSLAELIRARSQRGPMVAKAGATKPLVEKAVPSPAVTASAEKVPSASPVVLAEKPAASQPPKTGPTLAELLRERARGGAKKESAPIPPKPSTPSRTEAVPPKPPEVIPIPKSAEVPPTPSRGGGERSDLSPDSRLRPASGGQARSDLKEPPPVLKESTPEQQKVLTFENLATWPREDLAKLAAAVPDDGVWAIALQGMTTSVLEKAVLAAVPPGRVDNFALEGLTTPIKTKPEIEAKQHIIIAEAQKML